MKLERVTDFPLIEGWVHNELPFVQRRSNVWEPLLRLGRLTPATAMDALTGGIKSPFLEIRSLGSANGQFSLTDPSTIVLASEVAQPFEDDPGDRIAEMLVESTLLHELVHWGDFRAGNPNLGSGDSDQGRRFEIAAYGRNVQRPSRFDTNPMHTDIMAKPSGIAASSQGEIPPIVHSSVEHARPPASGGLCWPIRSSAAARIVPRMTMDGTPVGPAARRFKADRRGRPNDPDDDRFHAGIDLHASPGDVLVACEDVRIVNFHSFLPPTSALLVKTLRFPGYVLNYGEVEDRSWEAFGLERDSLIKAGEPLAKVGETAHGAMLHFEIYTRDTRSTARWRRQGPCPSNLLDPTTYLLHAACGPVST